MFDASGMKRKQYHDQMKQTEKYFAYGVTPCERAAHTLRTRKGNCIQCRPASITHILRNAKPGYVYIAGSKSVKQIKIGSSNDPENRIYIANIERYAGASDWRILAKVLVYRSGFIENEAHKLLRLIFQQVQTAYYKGDIITISKENYYCTYSDAARVLRLILASEGAEGVIEETIGIAHDQFEFDSDAY